MASKYQYRDICFDQYKVECHICPSNEDIEVHHIDGDRDNNDIDNLIPVCRDCHRRIHRCDDGYEEWAELLPDSSRIDIYTRVSNGPTRARITDETADRLHERKRRGESYNDVIVRLLDMADEMENDE